MRCQAILDSDTLTAEQIDTLVSRLGDTSDLQAIIEDGVIGDDEYSRLQGMMREAQWKNKNITELYYPVLFSSWSPLRRRWTRA